MSRERPTEILIRLEESVKYVLIEQGKTNDHLAQLNGQVGTNKENIAIIKDARKQRTREIEEIKNALKEIRVGPSEHKWNIRFLLIGGALGTGGIGVKTLIEAFAGG